MDFPQTGMLLYFVFQGESSTFDHPLASHNNFTE